MQQDQNHPHQSAKKTYAAISGKNIPILLAKISFAVLTILISLLLFFTIQAHIKLESLGDEQIKLAILAKDIEHYDEMLTMSARLTISQKDTQWKEHYKEHIPLLDQAIEEALETFDNKQQTIFIEQTQAANHMLIDMEEQAFSLAHAEKWNEAEKILYGENYSFYKQKYALGLQNLISFLRQDINTHKESEEKLLKYDIILTIILMVVSITLGIFVNHILRRWQKSEHIAYEKLELVNDELQEFAYRTSHDLRSLEPLIDRAVAVKLTSEHREYRTSIMGLESQRDLYRLLNTDSKPIRLPPSGIVLNDKLADILDLQPGEEVHYEVLEGERPSGSLLVSNISTEFAGTNAYMNRNALNQLMRETDAISGAFLAIDAKYEGQLYQDLKRTPQVASVLIQATAIQQFRDTIAKNQLTMQSFTLFFAAVIAIGVVYNTARIALDERSRELATLRVIGFTRGEVSTILLGELALLTLFAIPIGWAIGYGFCAAMVMGFESELYRFPLVIRPESYARAALVTSVAAAISGALVRRRLDQLDLVEVLKSRE